MEKLCFISRMSKDALNRAIENAGGIVALAAAVGVTHQAISQWRRCPPLRVLDVERATGIPRHELRPDIYPSPSAMASSREGDGLQGVSVPQADGTAE